MLFTHFSLLILAVALVCIVALVEVLRSSLRDDRRTWLKWHLWFTLWFNLLVFFDYSTYTFGVRYFYILEYPAILLLAVSYVELSYSAAGYKGSLHLKIYRAIIAVASLFWIYKLVEAVTTGAAYYSASYNVLLPLPILLFIWPAILFWLGFRRQGLKINLFGNYKAQWQEFSFEQKAAFAFWIVAIVRIISTSTPILARVTNLPQEAIWTISFTCNLFTLSAMTMIYLAYIEKRANLASRAANTLTVTLLSVFVVVVLFSYSDKKLLRGHDISFIANNSLEFRPEYDGYGAILIEKSWEDIEGTRQAFEVGKPVNIPIPFEFPFFGEKYTRLNIYRDGQIVPVNDSEYTDVPMPVKKLRCIYDQPVIAPFCLANSQYEVFIKTNETDGSIIIMWANSTSALPKQRDYAFQLKLTKAGIITVHFGEVPIRAHIMRHNAVGIHNGPGAGITTEAVENLPVISNLDALWLDLTYGRRQETHARLEPVVMFLGLAIIMVLLVYRPYISALIVKPLNQIKSGLREVDEGRFEHQLNVKPGDEFGDIAASFNKMIVSLDIARQNADEQTDLLEAEIILKAVDAANKNVEKIQSKDAVFEEKLLIVIGENISDFNFQVGELAIELAVSARQLHRRVLSLTNQTPATLIRNIRLENSHQLLAAKAANVSEAAYKSGFRDVSYFSKLFHKKYTVSPSHILTLEVTGGEDKNQ